MKFIVLCEDGVIRHDAFPTRGAAQQWANWGHACTTTHTITEEVVEERFAVTILMHSEDFEPRGTYDTREDAWLAYVAAIRDRDCFADGSTMAHQAWRFLCKGEDQFCNGVSVERVPVHPYPIPRY